MVVREYCTAGRYVYWQSSSSSTSGEQVDSRTANMTSLADALIARHLRISVPEGSVRVRLETEREHGYPAELVERRMRCIAVVGAGGSAPLLDRGEELAATLELKYGRDDVELERLALVNNLSPKDLETRLIALSRTPDAAAEVRDTISKKYNIRHPPVLAYELLAHLLKHRFLDAIISFNFDELLDRSLDDELDASEYANVVFERDCAEIQPDADADDDVPLYIKLHGTASEPASLRFTPDQYYSLPPQIVRTVRRLFTTEDCVIVNVGAGLGSFDFQKLLQIPDRLSIFNLSQTKLRGPVRREIRKERAKLSTGGDDGTRKRKQDVSRTEARVEGIGGRPERDFPWLSECATGTADCNEQLETLVKVLVEKARRLGDAKAGQVTQPLDEGPLVQFRATTRHEAVVTLLGSESSQDAGVTGVKPLEGAARAYPTAEIDYLRRRVILELAFAGAKARGSAFVGAARPGSPSALLR